MVTAASVDTRVLVLLLLNIIATVFPERLPRRVFGTELDLRACLWEYALRTRVANSAGDRSAIERRCRGANGETGGVVDAEYSLEGDFDKQVNAALVGLSIDCDVMRQDVWSARMLIKGLIDRGRSLS